MGPATDFAPNHGMEVTPAFFESVIRYLRDHDYEIVSMDDALERLATGERKRRFACITFDDGYRDSFELVLPLCQAEKVPFTVYVTSGFHDGRYSAWWLGLETLLATRSNLTFGWKDMDYAFPLEMPAQKQMAFTAIGSLFSPLSGDDRNALAKAVCAGTEVDFQALTAGLVMTPEMIAAIDQSDVGRIGSHTLSHARLGFLSANEARWEIATGAEELAAIVGHPVRHMAYPNGRPGDAGPREFELCRAFGLASAVTTRNANLMPAHKDHPFALPRLNMHGDRQNASMVELQLSGVPSALLNNFRRVVTV
jgi:peptidoglycan/xylan/chitin deacetylase (PgdA/CDA1 family)